MTKNKHADLTALLLATLVPAISAYGASTDASASRSVSDISITVGAACIDSTCIWDPSLNGALLRAIETGDPDGITTVVEINATGKPFIYTFRASSRPTWSHTSIKDGRTPASCSDTARMKRANIVCNDTILTADTAAATQTSGSRAEGLSVVPIPATLWLLGSSLIGLVTFARNRAKRRATRRRGMPFFAG